MLFPETVQPLLFPPRNTPTELFPTTSMVLLDTRSSPAPGEVSAPTYTPAAKPAPVPLLNVPPLDPPPPMPISPTSTQALLLQAWPDAQALPHPPQLNMSDAVLAHRPLPAQ